MVSTPSLPCYTSSLVEISLASVLIQIVILPRLHKIDTNLVQGLLFSGNADLTAGCESVLYADLIVLVDVPGYASEEDEGRADREARKHEPLLR